MSRIRKIIELIRIRLISSSKKNDIQIKLPASTYISHNGFGIVIGRKVTLGNNCKLYPNIVIGNNGKGYPTIGNNVTIHSFAVVVGDITIGDNSIITSHCYIDKNIPDNSVVHPQQQLIIKRGVEI